MRLTLVVLLLLSAAWAGSKEKKEKISIQILDSTSAAVVSGHVAGTNAYASTSCGSSGSTNINATATDAGNGTTNVWGNGSTNTSTNCQTVYHDATPGHDTFTTNVAMYASIPSQKRDVLLWCAVAWRQCEALSAGTYDAEIKDDVVWISVFGGARPAKIKYRIVSPSLLGLPANFEQLSPNPSSIGSSTMCSSSDDPKCKDVSECLRRGGTYRYCEMMYGNSQTPSH
ncbi:MAG TPA: hypothetical protein VFA90_00030 [Terriglobales bacterium]|nr:hypothetical protein [Terriglobales bacterium]